MRTQNDNYSSADDESDPIFGRDRKYATEESDEENYLAEDEKGNIPGLELKKGQLRGVEKREKKLGSPVRRYVYNANNKPSCILF